MTFTYHFTFLFILSFSKLRDHKLLKHSCMVNPSKMDLKIKSNKFVPGHKNKGNGMDGDLGEVVEEGEMETLNKEGKYKLEDMMEDDEFENTPLEINPEDYEGGWGEEFNDPEFELKLRG